VFSVEGKGAAVFDKEAGGHRWQRVPPTEKKGRTHTSTVTVAVLREPKTHEVELNQNDLEVKTCRGSGAGGQHRNVTDSAVQVLHKPSGVRVRAEGERSQHQNRAQALSVLRAKLLEWKVSGDRASRDSRRKQQVGSGMRGDKIRTIALQRGTVTDHRTGRSIPSKNFLRGDLSSL